MPLQILTQGIRGALHVRVLEQIRTLTRLRATGGQVPRSAHAAEDTTPGAGAARRTTKRLPKYPQNTGGTFCIMQ
jgi:hypothetical protein